MWMNQLFTQAPVNFEKRCKTRIVVAVILACLGAGAIGMAVYSGGRLPILYMEQGSREWIAEFYYTTGVALIAAGIVKAIRNFHILKTPQARKKQEIAETDERNRLIGLRCWAYSGYAMFLLLYIGVLAAGFISMTVIKVLLAVMGLYAFLLLVFRIMLQKTM